MSLLLCKTYYRFKKMYIYLFRHEYNETFSQFLAKLS